MDHPQARECDDVFGREVRRRADACRCEGELARLSLGSLDQLLDALVRTIARAHHHVRRLAQDRHVGNVLQRVVRQCLADRRVRRMRGRLHEQRVAVGIRLHHRRRADLPARPRPVLDDHRLLPVLVEALRDDAPRDIRARARSERHDESDRLVWVLLFLSPDGRNEREGQRSGRDSDIGFHGHPSVGMLRPGAGVSWCGQRVVTTLVRV